MQLTNICSLFCTNVAPTTSATAAVRVAGNGSVCVTCTFDAFSDAMGCVALFLAKNNMMKLLVRSITKHPNESSVDMCLDEQHGVYIVAVFERQSNGVISNDPAVVSQITVTVIPQATGEVSACVVIAADSFMWSLYCLYFRHSAPHFGPKPYIREQHSGDHRHLGALYSWYADNFH